MSFFYLNPTGHHLWAEATLKRVVTVYQSWGFLAWSHILSLLSDQIQCDYHRRWMLPQWRWLLFPQTEHPNEDGLYSLKHKKKIVFSFLHCLCHRKKNSHQHNSYHSFSVDVNGSLQNLVPWTHPTFSHNHFLMQSLRKMICAVWVFERWFDLLQGAWKAVNICPVSPCMWVTLLIFLTLMSFLDQKLST